MTDEKRLAFALRSADAKEPKATFQYLFEKYKPLVVFIAARYLKNKADIEDAVQETFMRFFCHAAAVRSSVRSYLGASAKNVSLRILKQRGEAKSFDPDAYPAPFDDALANEAFCELVADMKKIVSEEDVCIVLWHLVDDMTFARIARMSGKNVRTIKTKYFRALKKYKKFKEAVR